MNVEETQPATLRTVVSSIKKIQKSPDEVPVWFKTISTEKVKMILVIQVQTVKLMINKLQRRRHTQTNKQKDRYESR